MYHIKYSTMVFLGFSILLGGDGSKDESWIEMKPIGLDHRGNLCVEDEGRWVDEMEEELSATAHLIQKGGYYKRYDSISPSEDIFSQRLVVFDVVYGDDERKTEVYSADKAMKKGGYQTFFAVDPPRLVLACVKEEEEEEDPVKSCRGLFECWAGSSVGRLISRVSLALLNSEMFKRTRKV